MGNAVSKSNKDHINNNWDQLRCSPIGPFLQMIGVAPGNPTNTSNLCKSSGFSSQFNSSMTEHVNVTKKMSENVNSMSSTMNKFRSVIASMEQRAFEDLASIATQIFSIYVKLGNIFYVLIKNLINIMTIFKNSVNVAANIVKLFIEFVNLIRRPVNGLIDFVQAFSRI